MHIAIYETVHFENVVPLLRLFDLPGNRITVFCDGQAFRQAKMQLGNDVDLFQWVLQKPEQSRRHFLDEARRYVKHEQVQLLYINTISDNFYHLNRLIRAGKNIRTIATLHAINSYFSPQLKFNLRRVVRVVGKWMLRRTIQEYAVQSASMLPAARKLVDPRYAVHCIPGAVYDNKQIYTAPALPIHLVIAGSVDKRRRDYAEADSLILYLEKLAMPVRITMLGATDSAYGKEKISHWSAMQLQHVQLAWYETNLVPQDEYDRVLASAHFVYHPSTIEAELEDGATEVYGKTVCSGIFSDCIRHARPLILPATLSTDPLFEGCSFRYSGIQEIAGFLQLLISSSAEQKKWEDAGHEMAQHFTVEKIRQRNTGLFITGGGAS